jgi:hypothetical protein
MSKKSRRTRSKVRKNKEERKKERKFNIFYFVSEPIHKYDTVLRSNLEIDIRVYKD